MTWDVQARAFNERGAAHSQGNGEHRQAARASKGCTRVQGSRGNMPTPHSFCPSPSLTSRASAEKKARTQLHKHAHILTLNHTHTDAHTPGALGRLRRRDSR